MMETSSPLAAMYAPGLSSNNSPWSASSGLASSRTSECGSLFSRAGSNLSSKSESYFDVDFSMTSSPTSCLAADLSQNFHIDKTPAFPTPRRSLFAAFDERRRVLTTPPLPPSSPAPTDSMDISMEMSPLPHKTPFSSLQAKMNEDMSSPPCQPSPLDHVSRRSIAERKKSVHLRRPSLARARNITTSMIAKNTGSSSLFGEKVSPVFAFDDKPSTSSSVMSLEEMFQPSPVQEEKKVGLGLSMDGSDKPKPLLFGGYSSAAASLNGSPIPPAARRSLPRPGNRKVCRRALSMFNKAAEVIESEMSIKPICAQSPSQVAARESQVLPCHSVKDDTLKRITKDTMVDLLDGKYKHLYDEYIVIDCRFEYEYEGGHIEGAINLNNTDALDAKFLRKPLGQRTLLVFHCEYSAHRAPRMANHLRKQDRQANMKNYPALFYPELYVLEGGYSNFFSSFKTRCEPQFYVEMGDSRHATVCERELGNFRRKTKFSRAQSYTFGAALANNSESPSARKPLGNCPVNEPMRTMDGYGLKPAFGRSRSDPRRIGSY